MPRLAWAGRLSIVALIALGGCSGNSLALKGQVDSLQQQQTALSRQAQEFQSRATAMDRDNQDLQQTLAQARQQNKVMEDQLAIVRQQLGGATAQLARVQEEKTATDQKAQALTASLSRRGGVSISPNNSYLQTLPAINVPGVQVRRDGDVIRVELPASSLFDPGTVRFRPEALSLVKTVAAEVQRAYPNQIIGVEGHTEVDPSWGAQAQTTQPFSVNEASVVYNVLVSQARVPSKQLFLVGHGGNHPVVSNATPEGRQRNRRVELVIYPERVGQ
jgi:flagellar motor protein MotB